jgi:malic enzyme
MYVFPGIGLGTILSKSTTVSQDMVSSSVPLSSICSVIGSSQIEIPLHELTIFLSIDLRICGSCF